MTDLLPGRNYSISVVALSQGVPSEAEVVYQATSKLKKISLKLNNTIRKNYFRYNWKWAITELLKCVLYLDTVNHAVISEYTF